MRTERLLDAAIAAVAFVLTVALMVAGGVNSDADVRDVDVLGIVLAAGSTFPLVAWRRAPLAVFVVTAAASAVLNGVGYTVGPPFGPTVALFLLALAPDEIRPRTSVTAATVAALFVVHVTAVGYADDAFPTVPVLFGVVVWGGAWVLGDRVRLRRERVAELEARAERAERDAERERRLAAAEERTRIARDLHDSAGHAINVILVQAGAARLLGESDPERSRAALETIEEVALETLGEIDRLVTALREDDGSARRTASRASARPRRRWRRSSTATALRASPSSSPLTGAAAPRSGRRPGGVPHPPGGADERGPPRRRLAEVAVTYGTTRSRSR